MPEKGLKLCINYIMYSADYLATWTSSNMHNLLFIQLTQLNTIQATER